MSFFSKDFSVDASSPYTPSSSRSPVPVSIQGVNGAIESSELQDEILDGSDPATTIPDSQNDGSDPTTTTSNSSLDQVNSELRSTLATLATLDIGSLFALSNDDEYLGILKQLVGPLALNSYACGALAGHLEGLATGSGPQHRFTIHFLPHTVLPSNQTEEKQRSLANIVNRNIATEVKGWTKQQIVEIKTIPSPPSLVCSTYSPTLGHLLGPIISEPENPLRIILSNESPNIFKDSYLAKHRHGWWVRSEGEELYILHFPYIPTQHIKPGTSMYLESLIRLHHFRDMDDPEGLEDVDDIPIGAMRWQFVTPDYFSYNRPVDPHRYAEGWQAWFQVGRGSASAKEWLGGKEKIEMPLLGDHGSKVDVGVLVYRD